MRSPTLLTGLTGSVAVLVLIYVGLTAMNLQPHIIFGSPALRLASVDAAAPQPVSPAASAPVIPAPLPAETTAMATSAATPPGPVAPVAANPLPAPSVMPPAAPAPLPAPSVAAKAVDSPEIPKTSAEAAPQATPPAAAAVPPAAKPPLPDVAAAPAAVSPAPAVEWLPPVAAPSPPASPSDAPPAAAVSAALPSAQEPAISGRLAPTPSTPPIPLAASVPTPSARPAPPAAENIAKSAKDDLPPSNEGPVPQAPANKAPPTASAALTPQPEKPASDSTGTAQPDGDLKPIDLSRPFAERAGILIIGGRSVQLAGITPTDPERSCTGPNGKEWPCGTLARTALRSFLLGRTITCEVPDPAWKGTVTADCRFARLSIGDWLARNGWAEVASGSPFTAAADEARQAGRGVYGNDPRKKHQSTLAPEPPKEDPLNPI